MNKQEFMARLKARLSGLPRQEVEERLDFYTEMIDDRMEEGMAEEAAVSEIGSVEEIAAQVIADIPFAKIAKERIKPKKRLGVWEIVLLVLGSPVWLSLLVAACAVLLSLYVSVWSVIVSVWAVFASLVACVPGGVAAGVLFMLRGNGLAGMAMIGAGVFCAGLAIFLFFGCKAATKGTILLAKKIALGIKIAFVKKENAE